MRVPIIDYIFMSDEQQTPQDATSVNAVESSASVATESQLSGNTPKDLTALISWFTTNFKAVGLKRLAAQYMDAGLLPDESEIKPLAVPGDLDMSNDDAYNAFKQEAQKANQVGIENIIHAMDASGVLKKTEFWNDVATTTPFKVEEIQKLAKAYASDLQLGTKNEHLMHRFQKHMR